ncbi:hypothetical protein AAEU28_12110 [Pseudoalteromonas sp. SS15]|uniref:hypothetical protein n=1 Tax=Pseudoalteromonas sp. SS15 TaxID=3139393 RepID=UPI003BAA67AF
MNKEQNQQCKYIIHSYATAAAAGNCVPVPGLGIATDVATMTLMCMQLSAVFGSNINDDVAKGLAIVALKQTTLKQPIKVITKELSKLAPFLGQLVAPAISVSMLETAGWNLANELHRKSLKRK